MLRLIKDVKEYERSVKSFQYVTIITKIVIIDHVYIILLQVVCLYIC